MNPRTLLRSLVMATSLVTIAATQSQAQNLVQGTFEGWNTTTGTPPRGNPFFWSGTVTQTAGLVGGSNFSATIQPATTSDNLFQTPSDTTVKNLSLSFQFVATDSGSASNRSLQLILQQPGSTIPINMIITRGTSAGLLSLKASDGTAFQTIAEDIFSASTYNSSTGVWSSTSVYQMTLNVSFGAGAIASNYSVSYGLVGGAQSTLSNINIFSVAPTDNGVNQVRFTTNSFGSAFAIDNVSLTAIPEPVTSAVLLSAGTLAFAAMVRRRQ
ncbi:MAG: hypothetical protein WC205_09330 [Opitutaceae bacterium]|jgi:hypothetical protein